MKVLALLSFFVLFAVPSFSQNTKGDRAEVSGGSFPRKSRFKGGKKKKEKIKRPFNRVVGNKNSLANSARSFLKPRKSSANKKIYSQHGKYVNNPDSKPHAKDKASRSRVVVRSRSGRANNVFPQYGQYTSNPSRKPRSVQSPVSNRSTLARLNRLQGSPKNKPPGGRKRKVVPRSASRSFIRHKTINANAGFWNVRKKGEVAVTTDIAGRPLRAKNYHTPNQGVIAPTFKPYYGKKRIGDQPYKTSGRKRYGTTPRASQHAWSGDIAGRKIKGKNLSSKPSIEGNPSFAPRRKKPGRVDRVYHGSIPGNGYRSATRASEKRPGRASLPVRAPGIGASGVGNFQGNLKGQRPLKGGGSRSGKLWNNRGTALTPRVPGIGANGVGTFQGNLKGQRPLKGGGSRSGRLWNNRGTALTPRAPGIGANGIGTFQGNLKSHRPAKGGGSVSGRLWNNKLTPISVRTPSLAASQASGYPGKIKRYNLSPGFNNQGEEFSGYTRTKKPLKGGGSVSGKLWNNKQAPIPVRTPPPSAQKEGLYQGNIKRYEQTPGFNNQGEEFTGFKRLPRFKKAYIQNPNAAKESTLKKRPDKSTYQVSDLQVKVKQYHYVHNPSSADEALKVREPGKAFAKSTDYQGNIKMKKFDIAKIFSEKNRQLHPDAKYVKLNKNNVDSERDFFTNIRLWWDKTFRKNDTQPKNLKEKEHKPRYDKGEQGLWND